LNIDEEEYATPKGYENTSHSLIFFYLKKSKEEEEEFS
jgi:hypothetical protein